jgi:hypothetical protein
LVRYFSNANTIVDFPPEGGAMTNKGKPALAQARENWKVGARPLASLNSLHILQGLLDQDPDQLPKADPPPQLRLFSDEELIKAFPSLRGDPYKSRLPHIRTSDIYPIIRNI